MLRFENKKESKILRERYLVGHCMGASNWVVTERDFSVGPNGKIVQIKTQTSSHMREHRISSLQEEDYGAYKYEWIFVEKITYSLNSKGSVDPTVEISMNIGSKRAEASELIKLLKEGHAYLDIGEGKPKTEAELLQLYGCKPEDLLTGKVPLSNNGQRLFLCFGRK